MSSHKSKPSEIEPGWRPWLHLLGPGAEVAQFLGGSRNPLLRGLEFIPGDLVRESPDSFVVHLDLPGVDRDDIAINSTENRVTVHGHRKDDDGPGVVRQQSRHDGDFDYQLTLPVPVSGERTTATLRDGVLTITLPKAGSAPSQRIDIN